IANEEKSKPILTGLEAARVAIISNGNIADTAALTEITQMIVEAGGTVILSEQDDLLKSDYAAQLDIENLIYPSLGYAQIVRQNGFYIMAMPTRDWGEILTGLGASGIDLIISVVDKAMPGHPMI